jgi:hypothetical protein
MIKTHEITVILNVDRCRTEDYFLDINKLLRFIYHLAKANQMIAFILPPFENGRTPRGAIDSIASCFS